MIPIRSLKRRSPRDQPRGLFCFFAVLLFQLSSYPLYAHNPPEEYFGRNVTVYVEPACVRVTYRLEVSQISLFSLPNRDKAIQIGLVKGRAALEAACLERFKVLIPDNLLVFLNGKALSWSIVKAQVNEAKDAATLFHLELRADWKLNAGDNTFEIDDGNFLDAPGVYGMKFDFAHEIDVVEPRFSEKDRTGRVVFRLTADSRREPPSQAPSVEEQPTTAAPEQTIGERLHTFWQRIGDDDFDYLFKSNYALWLLVLVAFVHGAGHSLMPGHGKTAVAAYLVGERGTPWHAVLLGIVTTLTHTSAAIIVALLLRYVLPTGSEKNVNKVLMFGCGLMMLIVGIWLFLQRLAGRSDHVHLVDVGHGHSHGDTPGRMEPAGAVRLILLGIAGGIIPCWGAIMWVIGCIATGQFWLALPIVLAFSVGLAAVLVLIGLSIVYATRVGHSRWSERRWFKVVFNERTIRVMPVVGAALVMAIGLFFCTTSGIAAK